jgi:hypothetical protein
MIFSFLKFLWPPIHFFIYPMLLLLIRNYPFQQFQEVNTSLQLFNIFPIYNRNQKKYFMPHFLDFY